MAHETRKDYEATEVEVDVWICDSCDKKMENESDVSTFIVDPVMKFDHKKSGERLVWLNEDEGRQAVEQSTWIESKLEGHLCDECVSSLGLSTGDRVRWRRDNILHKLRERIL